MNEQLPPPLSGERTETLSRRRVTVTFDIDGDLLTAIMAGNDIQQWIEEYGGIVNNVKTQILGDAVHNVPVSISIVPQGELIWLNPAWDVVKEGFVVKWSQPIEKKQFTELESLICTPGRTNPITSVLKAKDGFFYVKAIVPKVEKTDAHTN